MERTHTFIFLLCFSSARLQVSHSHAYPLRLYYDSSSVPFYYPTLICHGTFEIVPQEVLWSIWGSHQTLWSLPLPNFTWHSGTWPYTMTPSIDQTLHLFANLLANWTLIPILTLLPNFGGFHRTLQRLRLANRGRLLLRTPGPVPFGTCICSNVETILSWTCHVYGPFEFRTSLGTSILPLISIIQLPSRWYLPMSQHDNGYEIRMFWGDGKC